MSLALISVILMLSLYSVLLLSRVARLPWQFGTVILAWYVGLAVVFGFFYGDFGNAPDGGVYDRQAMTVAERWGVIGYEIRGRELAEGKEGFPIIMGVVYSLGGHVPFAGVLLNCGVVALTAIVTACATRSLIGSVSLRFLTFMFMTWPMFIVMGPALLREALCWLGLALVALGISTWRQSSLKASVLLTLGWSLVWWIRTPVAWLIVIGVVTSLSVIFLRRRFGNVGVAVAGLLALVALIQFSPTLLEMSGSDSERLDVVRGALARTATSAYSVNAGPLEAVIGESGFLLANLPHIAFGPFPWELGPAVVWLWILVGSAYWWATMILIWHSYRSKPLEDETVVLLVIAATLLVGMGATMTNYGIVVRMRAMPMIALLVVLAGQPLIMRLFETNRVPTRQVAHEKGRVTNPHTISGIPGGIHKGSASNSFHEPRISYPP